MLKAKLRLTREDGLHARPAAQLVALALKYPKLEKLADKYEQFLNEVEKLNKGFRETYVMDLSGRFCIKQNDIPTLLRSGDLSIANDILTFFLKLKRTRER
jgi:hypothetical protein